RQGIGGGPGRRPGGPIRHPGPPCSGPALWVCTQVCRGHCGVRSCSGGNPTYRPAPWPPYTPIDCTCEDGYHPHPPPPSHRTDIPCMRSEECTPWQDYIIRVACENSTGSEEYKCFTDCQCLCVYPPAGHPVELPF